MLPMQWTFECEVIRSRVVDVRIKSGSMSKHFGCIKQGFLMVGEVGIEKGVEESNSYFS